MDRHPGLDRKIGGSVWIEPCPRCGKDRLLSLRDVYCYGGEGDSEVIKDRGLDRSWWPRWA